MLNTQEMYSKTPETKYELNSKLLCTRLLQQLFEKGLINRDTYEKAVKEVR